MPFIIYIMYSLEMFCFQETLVATIKSDSPVGKAHSNLVTKMEPVIFAQHMA